MNENKIQPLLNQYIENPLDPEINFWLGWEYEQIGQNASALSYYLRCAEMSKDKDLIYECLLKTWSCVNKSGRRPWYEYQQLITAITHDPKRPEAYYLLSKNHGDKKEWKSCYYFAKVGLELTEHNTKKCRTDVQYPGDFSLLFQKAFSSWYVGQRDLCRELWKETLQHPNITEPYAKICINNLRNFGFTDEFISSLTSEDNVDDSKIDIVLQGKCSQYVLDTANHYLQLNFVNNVILSCWEDDDIPFNNNLRIKIIKNNLPNVNGTGNRNLQIVSSLNGLKKVKTKFAIKMRNDQRYDLNSMNIMYEFFHKNKERIITYEGDETKPKNRILVAGMFEGFPFHPRDHVFWGHKEDLIDIFDMPLEPLGIEDKVKMKREDYWKYYDCYIRTESYIGSHYCSKFNEKIKKWLLKPEQYLYDDSPYYEHALVLSNVLSKQVFKSFPKQNIDLEWPKYGWEKYPYDSQYSRFNERWDEDGY